MKHIKKIIDTFEPISLAEMDEVKLLDRTDTKYMFNIKALPDILMRASEHYRVLDINNIRINSYETLYFDTKGLSLYNEHHNGKLNRYKIRYRCYKDSNLSFFEIKHSTNKNRTVKQRIKKKNIEEEITGDAGDFLLAKTHLLPENFTAKLWVYYSRITLVNKTSKERLTIDLNLSFKEGDKIVKFPKLVIAELKQDKAGKSFFTELMKDCNIRTMSISKYCFGIINIYENVKKNNFKLKLQHFNKIYNDKN